jgi:hypothetical protein
MLLFQWFLMALSVLWWEGVCVRDKIIGTQTKYRLQTTNSLTHTLAHVPPTQQLRDLGPSIAEFFVYAQDYHVLAFAPRILANFRVEVVVPAFAALEGFV